MVSDSTRARSASNTDQEWANRDDVLDWAPTPSVGTAGYTEADTRAELEHHLPSGWEIAEFDMWGPRRTNHGGPVGYQAMIEHEDGATISIKPAPTLPRYHGKIVYNSHPVWRAFADSPRQVIKDARSMVHRNHPATIFAVVVETAQEWTNRYQMYHIQDP